MGTGPFLKAATLCERVLIEKDDVVSVVRVFDRVAAEIQVPPGVEVPAQLRIEPWLFISFVRGTATEDHRVELSLQGPSGEAVGKTEAYPFRFPDGETGTANVIVQMTMSVPTDGTYWLKIALDSEEVTRLPLRISRTVTQK